MNKLSVFAIGLLILLGTAPAAAITIDGNLDDWGVTPYQQWAPSSPTAGYKEENDVAPAPSGVFLEAWDIEAMYYDNDADYLYFAIVTSKEQTSGWGDLGIDLNGDGVDEFGLDLTHFAANNTTAAMRDVVQVDRWDTTFYGRDYVDPADGKILPWRIGAGTVLGQAEVFQRRLGIWSETHPQFGYPMGSNFILEGKIDISLLGLTSLCNLPIELTLAKFSCLRDYMRVSGTCQGDCPVPEPASLILLGSALLGLGSRRLRLL